MEMLDAGVVIGKRNTFDAIPELAPPGPGFLTVMEAVCVEATRLEGMPAVNFVAETKLVASEVVVAPTVQFTTAPWTKPAPLTVSVKSALPGVMETGDMLLVNGTGFCALTPTAKLSVSTILRMAVKDLLLSAVIFPLPSAVLVS
jgi:hypothetical protein